MKSLNRIVLAVALLAPLTAFAYKTGNELIPLCTRTHEGERGYCFGYISGVIDAHDSQSYEAWQTKHPYTTPPKGETSHLPYCLPEKNTLGQFKAVFIKWTTAHPELTHYSADQLICLAMVEAFPCAGSKTKS